MKMKDLVLVFDRSRQISPKLYPIKLTAAMIDDVGHAWNHGTIHRCKKKELMICWGQWRSLHLCERARQRGECCWLPQSMAMKRGVPMRAQKTITKKKITQPIKKSLIRECHVWGAEEGFISKKWFKFEMRKFQIKRSVGSWIQRPTYTFCWFRMECRVSEGDTMRQKWGDMSSN